MIKKIFFAISLLIFTMHCFSQARKYANEFLSIGAGARAMAMANTHCAITDDITAAYWNPAGLTRITSDRQLALMHNEHFAGIVKYDYGAFGLMHDTGRYLALSIIRMGVDDIPNTTELIDANNNINYDRIRSFSIADYGFFISYAQRINIFGLEGLRVGGSVKVLHRNIGEFGGGWGFGIDAGVQHEIKNWQFGVMLRDLTSTFTAFNYTLSDAVIETFKRTNNETPESSLEIATPSIILGVARSFVFKEKFTLLPEANFDITFDGMRNVPVKSDFLSIDPHIGIEFGYSGIVFIRTGIGTIQQSTSDVNDRITTARLNFGVGVKIKFITIDYAMGNATQSTGLSSHVFSLKIDLNKKR